MVTKMFWFVLIHLLILFQYNLTLKENEIRLGGLFNISTTDKIPDQELIFQLAIEIINKEKILHWHELVADTVEVPDDQFAISTETCQLLSKGIVALFGPTAGQSSGYVQSICDNMEIPHIETRRDHLPQRGTCMLNLHPYPPTLARVYADIVRSWKWKAFTILYDQDESLPRINELLKIYDPKGYSVIVRRLNLNDNDRNVRPVLREAKENGEQYFIVECSGDVLYEILTQAQQVGIINDHYHFIITTLDMHTMDLTPFQYGGANITGVRMIDPENPMIQQAVSMWEELQHSHDRTLKESLFAENLQLETALMYDAVHVFVEAFQELNLLNTITARELDCNSEDNWEHGYSLINYMKMVNYRGLSGIIRFDNQGFRTDFELDVIELSQHGLQKIGTWNSTDGLNITRQQVPKILSEQEMNLSNRTFIVVTALTAPYGMLKDSWQTLTGNDQYEGFGIELIQEMSLMLGFNYTFIIQEDSNYGSKDKLTGEWSGMMKRLLDHEADLAITDLTITSDRETDFDFTMPFMNLGISILYKKASKTPPKLFSFMAPFSNELWLYMGLAYISVSLLFFIMGRLSPYEWNNPYPCIEEPEILLNQFSLTNSFWFCVGSLLQQGTEIAPAATSTRVMAGTWWFFTLIMVSSYTANLAACLTVENVNMPFKTAEELAERGDIPYGAKRGGSTEGFFKDATYLPYKKMYEYMKAHPHVMTKSNDDGVLRVKNTDYAFFMESTSIEYIVQRHCDLQQVGGLLDDKGYGIAMRKNSTYRSALSTAVLRLQEAGKLKKMKDKWWKEKRGGGACESEAPSEATALGLANVGGVFIVLVTGLIGSTVTAFCEMSFGAFTRSYKYKIPFREELISDIKFLIRCAGLTKPVRMSSEEDDLASRSQKSDEEKPDFDEYTNNTYDYAPDITKN